MSRPPFFALDLPALGLLPDGWNEELIALADAPERHVVYPSEFSPCLDGDGWSFAVVEGNVLHRHCPWLLPLYLGQLRAFSAASFDRPVFVERRLRSAMSLHVLAGVGARIDWHAHAGMVNGLLFVTSVDHADGGDLVFRDVGGEEVGLAPKAGTFVCFDGAFEHCVRALRSCAPRLTIPLIYFADAADQRPAFGADIFPDETP